MSEYRYTEAGGGRTIARLVGADMVIGDRVLFPNSAGGTMDIGVVRSVDNRGAHVYFGDSNGYWRVRRADDVQVICPRPGEVQS